MLDPNNPLYFVSESQLKGIESEADTIAKWAESLRSLELAQAAAAIKKITDEARAIVYAPKEEG
jgi:hypothetical protein